MRQVRAIRQAVVDRLGNIDDLTAYPKIPDSANVPCYWVAPDKTKNYADYQQSFAPGFTQYNFVLEIVTNRQDIESAQDILDDYVSADGPFFERLSTPDVGDALSDLVGNNIEVMTSSRLGNYKIGGAVYLGFQMPFTLFA